MTRTVTTMINNHMTYPLSTTNRQQTNTTRSKDRQHRTVRRKQQVKRNYAEM